MEKRFKYLISPSLHRIPSSQLLIVPSSLIPRSQPQSATSVALGSPDLVRRPIHERQGSPVCPDESFRRVTSQLEEPLRPLGR